MWLENLTCTSWNFCKNKAFFLKGLKTELSLLSQLNFLKIMAVLMILHEIWTAHIIKCWNVRKNKAVAMMSHGNLNCPYYQELKFSLKKKDNFNDITWKLDLPLLLRAGIFAKIRQFTFSDSKNWIVSIVITWNFSKIRQFW